MTYSRPSTSTVNAEAGVGDPMDIAVRGDSRVTITKNGAYQDNRNPNQLLRNSDQKTAVITNFIDTVTKQGVKVAKGALMDQANQQVGELLASTNPEDLMRSTSSPEQRDVVRSLNPFARDKLESWQAQYGKSEYQEIYTAESEKSKAVLTNPNTPDEIKAQIMGDIKQTSMQRSGLANVSPRALAGVANELGAFEGQVSGLAYAGTLGRQRKQDFVVLENGIMSGLQGYLLREQNDMSGLTPWMTKAVASQSEMFTPNEFAQATYSGIATQVQTFIAQGNVDAAVDLASGALALAKTDVKTPSGLSFFDIKDSEGKSLLYKLSTLSRNTLAAQIADGKLNGQKLVGESILDYESAGTPEEKDVVDQSFMASLSGLSPEARAAALATWGQAKGASDRPSELQKQNAAEAMLNITTTGLNKEDSSARLLEELDAERITASQYSVLLGQVANGNPDKDLYDNIDTARKTAESEISIATLNLVDIGNIDPSGQGSSALAGLSDKDKQTVVGNELRARVTKALSEQAKEARDGGDPWTTQMYVDKYKQELARQEENLRKEFSKGVLGGKTQVEKINDEFEFLGNSSNDGPLTVESFSLETIKRFKRNNGQDATPTVKALLGELSNQMKVLKMPDGTPLYPDAVKDIKGIARRSRIEEDKYGFWDKQNPLKFLMGVPQLKDLDTIQETEKIPEQEKDNNQKTSDTTSQKEDTPDQGFKKVLMQGLGALGNVVTAPAQAGTLEGKPGILNANNTPEFAKVMSRQLPLSIKTQALPQVSAATPVRRASIAIADRNHPFFLAIGIAEGTRTPSGSNTKAYYGHTDSGDGNRNRGTVSGGRSGGTPEQVDRQWMGVLTSVSTAMTPVLQRLGIPPSSQGWNRVMFNILDLRVQAPAAVQTFISKLPQVMKQGLTIEAIAKARADSFFNPRTGGLEAGGFGNNYSRLFADQRSRAGVYDYKRRF